LGHAEAGFSGDPVKNLGLILKIFCLSAYKKRPTDSRRLPKFLHAAMKSASDSALASRDITKYGRRARWQAAIKLLGCGDGTPKRRSSPPWPTRIDQKGASNRNHVGLFFLQNRFGLCRLSD
jgi:hypothetical protein